jgi:hypothetical protein
MIRRGFWLVAGAAIGVAGYRKATRLARTLTGQQSVARLTQGSAASVAPWPVRVGAGARSAAAFARDVREGMADYLAEHGGSDPAGYGAGPGGAHPAGGGVSRGALDPADGGALHGEQIGRSLGSRSPGNLGGRAEPGASQRGPREH